MNQIRPLVMVNGRHVKHRMTSQPVDVSMAQSPNSIRTCISRNVSRRINAAAKLERCTLRWARLPLRQMGLLADVRQATNARRSPAAAAHVLTDDETCSRFLTGCQVGTKLDCKVQGVLSVHSVKASTVRQFLKVFIIYKNGLYGSIFRQKLYHFSSVEGKVLGGGAQGGVGGTSGQSKL